MHRRNFLKVGASLMGGVSLQGLGPLAAALGSGGGEAFPFKLSLAQWSLHRHLFGRIQPKLDNLEFAREARAFGITGLEYVNQFFKDKAQDKAYLKEMKKRAADNGCQSVLIMCDGEGHLGDPDSTKRRQAVENHFKWLEAARFLGCHSIRVNAHSQGSFDEQMKLAADGLGQLCTKGQKYGLGVIVENHGGLSSNGKWLTGVMKMVNMPNCGTLPDFGNFQAYDRYLGTEQLMQYAKGVSAKSHDFDDQGNEIHTDFFRMMRIVRDAGYRGFVGIEYEGSKISERAGIKATKNLLERVFAAQKKIKPIFNGRNLDGWVKVDGGDWSVEDGVLVGRNGRDWSTNPEKSGSWLRTEKMYSDFRLELQYCINSRGNSGVMFRSAARKNPSFTGYEMQIYDGHGLLPSKHGPSAIYDVVAPTKNLVRAADEWNYVTIIAKGTHIIIEMNGEKVIDTNLNRSLRGYIGLQNHDRHSVVRFKNIRLEEL